MVEKISGLRGLRNLEDLWLNDNSVTGTMEDVERELADQKQTLISLYLERNPIVQSIGPNYERLVFAAFPKLDQLDSDRFRHGTVSAR